jgi:two-component system response regulator GlrR
MERKLRVLIVDDNVALNESLALLIERKGIETDQAYDGHQALRIIHSNDLDAVISDVSMPGMDGIELLGKIKQLREDLPVIIMSGNVDPNLMEEVTRMGAIGFLAKPINDELLISMLHRGTTPRKFRSSGISSTRTLINTALDERESNGEQSRLRMNEAGMTLGGLS